MVIYWSTTFHTVRIARKALQMLWVRITGYSLGCDATLDQGSREDLDSKQTFKC